MRAKSRAEQRRGEWRYIIRTARANIDDQAEAEIRAGRTFATTIAGAIHRRCTHLNLERIEELVYVLHEEYYKNIPWKM